MPFARAGRTMLANQLAVKMLPALSIVIPYGYAPVDPRIVDVPFGVILETLFASPLAV